MKCFPHLNLTDIENFFYVVLPFKIVDMVEKTQGTTLVIDSWKEHLLQRKLI